MAKKNLRILADRVTKKRLRLIHPTTLIDKDVNIDAFRNEGFLGYERIVDDERSMIQIEKTKSPDEI
jgi:hypothetical protein